MLTDWQKAGCLIGSFNRFTIYTIKTAVERNIAVFFDLFLNFKGRFSNIGNAVIVPRTALPTAQPKMAIAILASSLPTLQTKTRNLLGNIGKFGKLHPNWQKR